MGTRHSGDQNTSCDNSTIEGLALMFVIFEHVFETLKVDISVEDFLKTILMLLLGDDNLTLAPSNWLTFDIAAQLLKLGLVYEPLLHHGPNARYFATFCSSRFYPCASTDGTKCTVLAPKIGRVYGKYGYYDNPPPNIDLNRMVRGDALGRRNDCSMLPFIRKLVDRTVKLTDHIKDQDIHLTASMKKRDLHNFHATKTFVVTDETWNMVSVVYGLQPFQEAEYESLLNCVTSLPSYCDYTPLRHAAIKDGELTTPDLEDLSDRDVVIPMAAHPHIRKRPTPVPVKTALGLFTI
jgi:hypothetical protein